MGAPCQDLFAADALPGWNRPGEASGRHPKAAYNDTHAFFRFDWPAQQNVSHDYLYFEGGKWNTTRGSSPGVHPQRLYEDRVSFLLDDGAVRYFDSAGGFITIHDQMRFLSNQAPAEEVEKHAYLGGKLKSRDVRKYLPETRTGPDWRAVRSEEELAALADRVGVLNHGRLAQLDTPERIYHRPATPFVAEFVGAATFVPGVVTTEGIVTELGTFTRGETGGPGERVSVMVRPEDVTFLARDDGEAVVLRRNFRWTETRYRVGLPSGRILYSSQPSWAPAAVGDRVRVAVRLEHVVTFPEVAERRGGLAAPGANVM